MLKDIKINIIEPDEYYQSIYSKIFCTRVMFVGEDVSIVISADIHDLNFEDGLDRIFSFYVVPSVFLENSLPPKLNINEAEDNAVSLSHVCHDWHGPYAPHFLEDLSFTKREKLDCGMDLSGTLVVKAENVRFFVKLIPNSLLEFWAEANTIPAIEPLSKL